MSSWRSRFILMCLTWSNVCLCFINNLRPSAESRCFHLNNASKTDRAWCPELDSPVAYFSWTNPEVLPLFSVKVLNWCKGVYGLFLLGPSLKPLQRENMFCCQRCELWDVHSGKTGILPAPPLSWRDTRQGKSFYKALFWFRPTTSSVNFASQFNFLTLNNNKSIRETSLKGKDWASVRIRTRTELADTETKIHTFPKSDAFSSYFYCTCLMFQLWKNVKD